MLFCGGVYRSLPGRLLRACLPNPPLYRGGESTNRSTIYRSLPVDGRLATPLSKRSKAPYYTAVQRPIINPIYIACQSDGMFMIGSFPIPISLVMTRRRSIVTGALPVSILMRQRAFQLSRSLSLLILFIFYLRCRWLSSWC